MTDIGKKLDKYLTELDAGGGPNDAALSSIATGLRRIQYKLERANTPQKYVEVFEMISALVASFPLKSKIIWGAVATAYTDRWGSAVGPVDGQ